MDKVIEWLTQKFSHPLSLLFFLLGAILLLLGLTTGFEIPFLKQLAPALEYQGISLILGGICLLVSILIYYKPPKKKSPDDKLGSRKTGDELPASFFARKALISKTQKELLSFIEKKKSVPSSDIGITFKNIGEKELFYRLEQLRLLGFIEKKTIGKPEDTMIDNLQVFSLSEKFEAEITNNIGWISHESDSTNFSKYLKKQKRNSAQAKK